jgi:hypothetical protein
MPAVPVGVGRPGCAERAWEPEVGRGINPAHHDAISSERIADVVERAIGMLATYERLMKYRRELDDRDAGGWPCPRQLHGVKIRYDRGEQQ